MGRDGARAPLAEDAGLDGVWVFDHFKALYGDPTGHRSRHGRSWPGCARDTRVRLGTLVTGMTHRHPSVLAAEVVTVDHLSGGRVECAVGAAWNEPEHRELGIPFPSTAERMDRLEEGIQVLRSCSPRTRHVRGPPPPARRGDLPSETRAAAASADLGRRRGAARTLPIVGRYADVWHGWAADGAEFADIKRIIDRAAEEAGRDPASILRASSLSISEPWDDVKAAYGWMAGEVSATS